MLKAAALDVPHPFTEGKSLWDARHDEGPYSGASGIYNGSMVADMEYLSRYEADQKAREALDIGIDPLGSGSDYTVFLQRIGVQSFPSFE